MTFVVCCIEVDNILTNDLLMDLIVVYSRKSNHEWVRRCQRKTGSDSVSSANVAIKMNSRFFERRRNYSNSHVKCR